MSKDNFKFLILLLLLLLLASCGTHRTASSSLVENVSNHVADVSRVIDSVYVHERDSIFIHSRGDTVFVERYRLEVKNRTLRDTVMHTDSLTVFREKEVERTVEVNRLTWWQKAQIYAARVLAAILLLYVIYNRVKS